MRNYYIREHFSFNFFFFSTSSIGCNESCRLVSSFNSSSKSSVTFVPFFADVSMYLHFHICYKKKCDYVKCAWDTDHSLFNPWPGKRVLRKKLLLTCNASPVFCVTWRSPDSSSHLFPTSITGMPVKSPFTWNQKLGLKESFSSSSYIWKTKWSQQKGHEACSLPVAGW